MRCILWHDGHHRPADLTRVEGDRAHLHVPGVGDLERSVWCLRFQDREAGCRLRERVRRQVAPDERTGAGRRSR